MSISDRFKQELQANNFEKALDLVLSETMNLEIVTRVGDDAGEPPSTPTSHPTEGQIRTRINVLEGTVDNQVEHIFLDNDALAHLRDFHSQQVQASQTVIREGFASLQALLDRWVAFKTQTESGETLDAQPLESPASEDDETIGTQPAMADPLSLETPLPGLDPTEIQQDYSQESAELTPESSQASPHSDPWAESAALADDEPENVSLETMDTTDSPEALALPQTGTEQLDQASAEDWDVWSTQAVAGDPDATLATASPVLQTPAEIKQGSHDAENLEFILSHLFAPNAEEPEPGSTSEEETEAEPSPVATSDDLTTSTPKAMEDQIDLSIDELLADLFYEEERPASQNAASADPQTIPEPQQNSGNPQVSSASEPRDSSQSQADLNFFADHTAEPPRLTFDG